MAGACLSPAQVRRFRAKIYRHFDAHGRRLPWRTTRNPYRTLVSEMMLQQTQVERVKPFYRAFLARFPTVRVLAHAPLADVLSIWQGLGYNRRAKFLHDAAKAIVARHSGRVPRDAAALEALPGIGAYTAGAVRVFAWNEPSPVIETNIRNVFTHEFFPRRKSVRDRDLLPLIKAALDQKNPRRWYAALMDYGAALKKTERHLNMKNAHYVRQKPFKNSPREVRGKVLALLVREHTRIGEKAISSGAGIPILTVRRALRALATDGLIEYRRGCAGLA